MADYIVEMRHITKRFPGIVANKDVTIQIKKGEIYAILGENGAGKSTLMSMLFGMYEPDEGEIYIRGKKEIISSPRYATQLNIGMVHQHFKLVSNYTIAENIIMGIEPVKKALGIFPYVDIKGANEKIARLSRQYGLEVDPKKVISDINVSVQQRVEILKMLYREAEILIFDEPTALLTPQEIEFLLKIIKGLRDGGKTIILITHKLEEIKKVADRCAILRRGELIDVLDVQSTSTKEMASKMVGREVSFTLDKTPAKFRDVVLDVKNLTVTNEDKFQVVKNVSFSVHGGEIFAIAGVSGNGQVEIADAIAGLMKANSGQILLNGKDITEYSIRKRTLEGIAYIPEDRQTYGLILDFTLEDNLALKNYFKEPFSRKGILNKKEFETYGEKLIQEYDVRSGQGNRTQVRSMSGGNQQKAIIAREIQQDTPLLIFVQPTRGLDIGAIENIHKQILAERDKGKAILLISLELDEIMNLADTIGVIYNGQIQKIADASTLTTKEVGQFMMGVKNENDKDGREVKD
ncbi:ABC transporter ATP-binding protein [Blautia ammoniilytica]|uniref:ABC transporter ATP-binding protein n=1 Tax=Blautia ammoniilytica TaxID=2981782 RepID=A0ABT2TQZ1_9FIRM|nr:ABC transporter ATP-binding protein [Blautia ammoniilytica]MCU6764650.1 ABC transporter ATP-binding protein [Blautia ammoniilytica]MDY3086777.1 ABC transporter ATP-binding protein [Blautia sp.]SCH52889.1 Galactose/methyl galactoside import ATP-binding protein MglA [uncultured Blautia sp.]